MKIMKSQSLKPKSLFIFCILLFLPLFSLQAEVKFEYENAFVSVNNCKMCHAKPALGNQHAIWSKTAHSKSFATLQTPKAKELGKKLGVAAPDKDDACLVCHTTAFGASKKQAKKIKQSDGIQCERCHGPGKKYSMKMKKIAKERKTSKDGSSETAVNTGLMIPAKQTCLECHVKEITVQGKKYVNPAHKPFDFEKSLAKMSHRRK